MLTILVHQGVENERALDIVRRRFAAEGGHYAAWVLYKVGHAEDVTLFVDKIRELYQKADSDPTRDFGSSDLHNWLAFVPDDDIRYPELLRDGLESPNEEVRESAYFFLASAPFPEEERVSFVRAGLRDSSAGVRYWATRYYAGEKMSSSDWEILRTAAEQERDDRTRKEMNEVLDKQDAAEKSKRSTKGQRE